MGISFGSINTGLPKDIVKQIMVAEKIPMKKMEGRKEKIEAKKALVDQLVKHVEDIRGTAFASGNARSLRELKVDTNENIIGVNFDKNVAMPGNYQIEVLQLAQKSSAISSGFEDKDNSYIGVGFIQYSLPNGEEKEIYVDSEHSSLTSLAKLINKDSANGMRASVINDGSNSDEPWKIIISLEETGDGNKAEFPYFYFVDGEDDFYLESERAAQDAKIKLDGFEVELSENKAKDLIPGVTIDLKKASPGEEFSLAITEDNEAITGKVDDIINKINTVFAFIKEQNTLDEKSDTSRTLGGDSILQSIESRLRRIIFQDIKTSFGPKRFGDLGVSFQRDGTLELDKEKFSSQVADNYKQVAEILTGYFTPEGSKELGFIDNLSKMLSDSLQFPSGILQSRKRSLRSNIDQIDRRIADKQRLLEQKEKNLKQKFARLEETISRIKNSGAGIAALGGGGFNPVQQL